MGIIWYHLGSRRVVEARRATYGFIRALYVKGALHIAILASVNGVGALTALGLMIEGVSFYRTHDLEHKPQCLAHARCNAFPLLLNTPP